MTLFSCNHYPDNDFSDSDNSDVDSYEFNDNDISGFKWVDFYNFLHDFKTETTKEALHYKDFNKNNYSKFDDGYSITLMKHLNNNDIDYNIREITNNVTCINFDKNYS